LEEILGYPVEGPIHIQDVRDLGEWKTAWDHVVFEGFLGVRMKLQFTWDGCDSSLAAPLVLDLVRLAALALERGEGGVLSSLAFFFKDPAGIREHRLHCSYELLERWVTGDADLKATAQHDPIVAVAVD
jgi:myo-inositol-1-phosphate synthase